MIAMKNERFPLKVARSDTKLPMLKAFIGLRPRCACTCPYLRSTFGGAPSFDSASRYWRRKQSFMSASRTVLFRSPTPAPPLARVIAIDLVGHDERVQQPGRAGAVGGI